MLAKLIILKLPPVLSNSTLLALCCPEAAPSMGLLVRTARSIQRSPFFDPIESIEANFQLSSCCKTALERGVLAWTADCRVVCDNPSLQLILCHQWPTSGSIPMLEEHSADIDHESLHDMYHQQNDCTMSYT